MNYGDFQAVIQLGIALHVGSAILQLYGEVGLQKYYRTRDRIHNLLEDCEDRKEQFDEQLQELWFDFDRFRMKLDNEYKKMMAINSFVALALAVCLIGVSYAAKIPANGPLTAIFVFVSFIPAPVTLAILWFRASSQCAPITNKAEAVVESITKVLSAE